MNDFEFGYLYRFQNRDDNTLSAIYVNKGKAFELSGEEVETYVVFQLHSDRSFMSVMTEDQYKDWLKDLLETHYRVGEWVLTKCSS